MICREMYFRQILKFGRNPLVTFELNSCNDMVILFSLSDSFVKRLEVVRYPCAIVRDEFDGLSNNTFFSIRDDTDRNSLEIKYFFVLGQLQNTVNLVIFFFIFVFQIIMMNHKLTRTGKRYNL
jgi:hypothetical protein